MNKLRTLLLAVFSGLLFAVSWPEFGSFVPLLFVAFCPVLYIQHIYQDQEKKGLRIIGSAFIAFFTWNIITTYWLLCVEGSYITIFLSGFMPSIINSLVMLFPFWLFHLTKKKLGNRTGLLSFPVYWLSMEYFHLQWDLTWTWLEIGNAFAAHTWLIQWYEYTGVHGGTLWVLVINLMVFNAFLKWKAGAPVVARDWLKIATLIVFPAIASLVILAGFKEKGEKTEVVVVQPNIDPYNEKFILSYQEQLYRMLRQADKVRTPVTTLLVFPETALQEPSTVYFSETGELELTGLWENTIDSAGSIKILRNYLSTAGKLDIIAGLSSDSLYSKGSPATVTARKLGLDDLVYDSFNTGMLINEDTIQLYHKSKLVPAVERMPFVTVLRPVLGDAAINFGGTSGGLGMQDYRSVFRCRNSPVAAAPVICYESVYGEYVGDYIKEGANLITIITNDGWWGNTPGHKHHMAYAKLRAIEHRRDIARSANTGISGFINQKGEITRQSEYWVETALRGTVRLNEDKTFYTRFGDYIGRSAFWLSILLVIWVFLLSRFFFKG